MKSLVRQYEGPFSIEKRRIFWTGMRVVKHDGSRHHLVGIQPTVPMTRTIQGVGEERDGLFEKALESVKK